MSFTPNIPASGQTLGNSRPQVLANFATLRTTISNATQPNHIDVNNAGAGKHIFVQMPVQTPGAANLPAANEGGFITQTVGANSELFFVRDNVNTYYQMTGPFTGGTNGNTPLFGGLLLQWGQATIPGGGTSVAVVFPVAYSAPAYSVVLTAWNNPITGSTPKVPGVTNVSNTGFDAINWNGVVPGGGVVVAWMAIGAQ